MNGYIYKITLNNDISYIGLKERKKFDPTYLGSSKNKNFWEDLIHFGIKEHIVLEYLEYDYKLKLIELESYLIKQNGLWPHSYNLYYYNSGKRIYCSDKYIEMDLDTYKSYRRSYLSSTTYKDYKRLYDKKRYNLHSDEIKAKVKEYRINNASEVNTKKRKYRINNLEKIIDNDRKYKSENKDKILEQNRIYKVKNYEKILEQNRVYQKEKRRLDKINKLELSL